MADDIKKVQTYLNNMYGHREDFPKLVIDGNTGTKLCQAIIRAFQIENGVEVTGNVGNKTLTKMRELKNISIMDPNGETDRNVAILQCALFAKGYNAGGITGIYYTTGVNAVKQYQRHANLEVTGIIDWKVWMGLVSINWFKIASGGDEKIRTIQQQLNADWSDIIGVGPCDGVVTRTTAYAMIAALQTAEGINTEFVGMLAQTNFGDLTTAKFPTVLKQGQNGDYVKYNKLVQYGLYTNGYDPGRFDGIFDSSTAQRVAEFQEFYALTGIGLVTLGEVNCSTMKSLLTSKGDTARKAKACDCSTILNKQQALDIKNAGYQIVGRYLTGTVGGSRSKALTLDEIENIINAGLSLFPIYQDGGTNINYFMDDMRGYADGYMAIIAARNLGIPSGTTIYFSVDFDCYEYELEDYIVPYFTKMKLAFMSRYNTKNYKIGVYAPRYVCTRLGKAGCTSSSFVADMSSGFSCNLGYPIPRNWAFDQFFELNEANGGKFPSSPSFDLDKVAYSGRDKGCNKFDKPESNNMDEIEDKNSEAYKEALRSLFAYNTMKPFGFFEEALNIGVVYDIEQNIASYVMGNAIIDVKAKYSTEYRKKDSDKEIIEISLDSSGNMSAETKSKITNLSISIEEQLNKIIDSDAKKQCQDSLSDLTDAITSISLSVKDGYMSFEFKPATLEFIISYNSKNLAAPSDSMTEVTMSVDIIFQIIPSAGFQINEETLEQLSENALMVAQYAGVLLIAVGVGAALGCELGLLLPLLFG